MMKAKFHSLSITLLKAGGPCLILMLNLISCRPFGADSSIAAITPTETRLQETTSSPVTAKPIFGIEENRLGDEINWEQLRALGVTWFRRNGLQWSDVEPERGRRNWEAIAALEQELAVISSMGAETILVVRSTPPWAQALPGISCGPLAPEAHEDFGRFLTDAVRRLTAHPFNVKYWELWNEPDVDHSLVSARSVFGCWGDRADAFYGGGAYADMLKVAYQSIKAVDPEATVLIGGLLLDCDPLNPPDDLSQAGTTRDCTSSLFLQGILENGGGPYFDGVSFHAYDYYFGERGKYGNLNWNSTWDTTGPVVRRKAAYLRAVLNGYGLENKALFNSENALLCGSSGTEDFCLTEDFENTKGNYLIQSFIEALRAELTANVWYSLRGWRGSGLLDQSNQPNSSYGAYRFTSQQLINARFINDITMFPGVSGVGLQDDGRDLWILWSLDSTPQIIQPPVQPSEILTLDGQPIPVDGPINVTDSPIVLIWNH